MVFTVIFVLAQPVFLFADTLFLKSGKVLECRVLEKTKDYVKVEYSGRPLYFELKYVRQIDEQSSAPAKEPAAQEVSAEQWSREIAEEINRNRASRIKVVITASAVKGFSPLKVVFNGLQSSSSEGRITSYYWDFGDGDTSRLGKASNTYISMSYGVRVYTVRLIVEDDRGNRAFGETSIFVTNKGL